MVLDDAKIVLNTDKDNLISIYIKQGITLIRKYLNLKNTNVIDIETVYSDALIQYVVEQYRKHGLEGTKQYSQGSRSGTLTNALSENVKALLPLPRIRLMG